MVRTHLLRRPIMDWYAAHARDLPWRGPQASAWEVMMSEFMLQQTPVNRVLPVFLTWRALWPTPAALADAPSGEAVRAWGRLGYPRRALRLHQAATAIVDRFDGEVPRTYEELLSLPGVGDYTAAAIASFAYGAAHPVLDTNVRRVFARAVSGVALPPTAPTKQERELALSLMPKQDAATWAVAVMELGALVCKATAPDCAHCPIRKRCAWLAAGKPTYDGPVRKTQTYDGTDRQCRGRLLGVLRDADGSVPRARLDQVWPDGPQRERALTSLLDDGLVVRQRGRYQLPK